MLDGYKTKIGVIVLAIWGIVGLFFGELEIAAGWKYVVDALIFYGIYDKVGRK